MSVKTTYTCDRCGYETDSWDAAKETRQMHSVGVVVTDTQALHYARYSTSSGVPPKQTGHWCGSCVQDLGLKGPPPKPDADPAPPTLEEIIREIVREEMSFEGG